MPIHCTHREDCRLCGARALEVVLPLAATPIADEYVSAPEPQESFPLDVYLCTACGHTQLADVVAPERLFRDYTYRTAVSLGLVEHFGRLAAALVERFGLRAGDFAGEIGSNDGSMLNFFRERGLRVLGVDPARDIAAEATARGVETLPEFFTSALGRRIRAERGAARLVLANNVFAHADALGDIADGIREMLADDGVFVFEVSYMLDILDRMLFDTVYHEHLCYHAVRPFQRFFAAHGLELFDVERIATKGGSIRGFVQRAGGPHAVRPIVGELVALEAARELDRPAPYRALAARIDAAKRALLAEVDAARARGESVAGYGASATVTTLLHHFDLGKRLDFLVDDNPLKQGTFSPGHHIPVLAPSALRERKPAHVVVLAWAYADPILKKNQAYLEQGGRFLVPLPELKVYGNARSS